MSERDEEIVEQHLHRKEKVNEYVALVFGILVGCGLILECALAVLYRPDAPFGEKWGPVIADALVTVGVFGEIFFEGRAKSAAEKTAARAAERTAQLEREAAILKRENLLLEQKIDRRRLSREQSQRLVDAVAGKITPICIVSYGPAEAHQFANEIFSLLEPLGLIGRNGDNVHRITCAQSSGQVWASLFIPVASEREYREDPLFVGLTNAGVRIVSHVWGDGRTIWHPGMPKIALEPDERVLTIGEKPLFND